MIYASDFLRKGFTNFSKVYLSGPNSFVRGLVIDKIMKDWGISKSITATKNSDIKVCGNLTVFGKIPVAYILTDKAEHKDGLDTVIKVSTNKISKKYKDAGYVEIVCSDFFPNQVEEFTKHYLTSLNVCLADYYSKFICVSCNYDLVAITNVARILSAFDSSYLASLSHQDFALICGNLCVAEESSVVANFIDGDYAGFLNKLQENPRLIKTVLWNLVFALMKVREVPNRRNPTWYQKKLLACAERMEHFGLDRVIILTHDLAESYRLKYPQIMLELTRLIKALKGELKVIGKDR
jgi:hypothetical protein